MFAGILSSVTQERHTVPQISVTQENFFSIWKQHCFALKRMQRCQVVIILLISTNMRMRYAIDQIIIIIMLYFYIILNM